MHAGWHYRALNRAAGQEPSARAAEEASIREANLSIQYPQASTMERDDAPLEGAARGL